MAKTKTPFFSFSSRGTVGGVLTAQKRGRETLLRSTPKPTDPYSLNQAYQRWDYRDYAYLWTLLSNSEKQIYRTKGSRYHITGFSLWMRESLKQLTSLAGRWHLDEKSGAIAYDSSKNNNNGIIHGATPVDGLISGAYSFDGENDWIDCGTDPSLTITEEITIAGLMKPLESWESHIAGQSRTMTTKKGYDFLLLANDYVYFDLGDGTNVTRSFYPYPEPYDTWHYFTATWDGEYMRSYLDGVLKSGPIAFAGPIEPSGLAVNIGRSLTYGYYAKAHIDNVAIYSRALDQTEILRHSKRRYPA